MRMTNLFIFAGPSLDTDCIKMLPKNHTLLPPIVRGDIKQLLEQKEPAVVIIIDGYFDHQLAVSHRELCKILDQGWQLWGLSAMGAIRAYELREQGMKGYGQVYNYFQKRADFRDDEVAFLHDLDPPYQRHSEALVHLRCANHWLVNAQLLTSSESGYINKELESIEYGKRTLDYFLKLIRKTHPLIAENQLTKMLKTFNQFRIQQQDCKNFFCEQPWLN